jgi:hypothetical protein
MTVTTDKGLFSFEVSRIDASGEALRESFGARIQSRYRRGDPTWEHNVLEAERFMEGIYRGTRGLWQFAEAMSTSDFPLLFADSLDRQLYGAYQATPATWMNYARSATVNDFRNVKRFATSGIRGLLSKVNELAEHERRAQTEAVYEYRVDKYEAGFALSWETMVNDDLDAFSRLPQDLADSARDSEEEFVTRLFADANGPDATFYTTANGNVLAGNPPLSRDSLQDAITQLMQRTDERGNPIAITAVELVVGPGLALQANEILDTREYRLIDASGNEQIISGNGVAANLRRSVNFWIPFVVTAAGVANTAWWLFASPSTGRPAIEFGRLRGYEAPALFEKVSDSRRIGGGLEPWSFDTESAEKKIKHVYGGTLIDPRSTIASNGSGSS